MSITKFSIFNFLSILFLLISIEIHSQYSDDSSNQTVDLKKLIEESVLNENDSNYFYSEEVEDVEIFDPGKIKIDSLFIKEIIPFESNLREKYSSSDYNYEQGNESPNYFKNIKEWLEDFIKKLFGITDNEKAKEIADIVEYVFYTVVFLILLYFIIKIFVNKEGRFVFKKKAKAIEENPMNLEEEIQSENLFSIIEKYVSEKNYRMAVRYYYVWVLKNLKEKNIIQFSADKTTDEYINEISDKNLKKEFKYASYLYTYIWYGNFEIDETEFRQIESKFKSIL